VVFDPQEELLWAATFGGHVTSYLGPGMETYTSVQAHHSEIRQLELTPAGVLSVADSELRYMARTGFPVYCTIRDDPQLVGMNCLLYVGDTSLLVGCQSGQLVSVDLSSMQPTSQMRLEAGLCLLKASEHLLCTADVTGQVYLQARDSLQLVHRFPAHSAGMSDMDVVGHCLVTCGLTHRFGQLCVDPELSVMDLRMLRLLPPLPATMPQPMLVRSMPSLPSTALLLSQLGEFQFVDIRGLMTPAHMAVHQLQLPAEGAMPTASDVSPSCHCLAFGDSCGQVHLWMSGEDSVMNAYAQPSVLPDQVEACPQLSWDGSGQPLAAIPLPACSGRLLSDWPPQNSRFMRRRAPIIDPKLLASRKMNQFVGHAPKPPHLRRNQVPYDLRRESKATVPESPMMRETNPLSLTPKPYRQVEIKYSRLGIETFDFAHYNDTRFAGLEIHIPNAYCNSMLQQGVLPGL
jgi:PAB-dependent poly(A)-specific ribonuclease subunit 2